MFSSKYLYHSIISLWYIIYMKYIQEIWMKSVIHRYLTSTWILCTKVKTILTSAKEFLCVSTLNMPPFPNHHLEFKGIISVLSYHSFSFTSYFPIFIQDSLINCVLLLYNWQSYDLCHLQLGLSPSIVLGTSINFWM